MAKAKELEKSVKTKKKKEEKALLHKGDSAHGTDQKSTTASVEADIQEEVTETAAEAQVAKAGKRSAKALKEESEKQAKEARKAAVTADQQEERRTDPKLKPRTAEDRLKSRGKQYRKVYEQVDRSKLYSLKDAVELTCKLNPAKFDASVELHINLFVDPKQADQNIRGTVVLPAGTGRNIRVAVYGDASDVAAGKKAGADIAAGDELLQQFDKEVIEFDVLIASPVMMAKLGKYARLLGPKGLMPNPKSGTVTKDVAKAVTEAKAGRVEYRVDSSGIVHLAVGKVSFGPDKVLENVQAVLASIKQARPASVKGTFIDTLHLTTTMGPSVRVEPGDL